LHLAADPALHGPARLAGLFYVLVVITGVFSLGIAPSTLFDGDTDAARHASLAANIPLLKASILGELACYVAFAGTAVALHRLLAPTGGFSAAMMAVLALVSVPFGFANVAHLMEILRLLETPTATGIADVAAAHQRYRAGIALQSIPWGLWLVPLGWLTIRCGYLPKLIGVLLILAGFGYVIHFTGRLLVPDWRETIWPQVLGAPRVGEMMLAGWLLVFGARDLRLRAAG
jgi:hypothetical protein